MEERVPAGLKKNNQRDSMQPDKKALREFGLTTGGVIALSFGLVIPWIFRRHFPVWPRIVSGVLVSWALVAPATLRLVHRGWMKFGLIMNRITTPIVLGVIYLLVITPAGAIMRLLGRDPMMRKFDNSSRSYRLPSRKIVNKNMEKPF